MLPPGGSVNQGQAGCDLNLVKTRRSAECCFGVVAEFASGCVAQCAFEGVQQYEVRTEAPRPCAPERFRCAQLGKSIPVVDTDGKEPLHGSPADVLEFDQLIAQKGLRRLLQTGKISA